MDSNHEKTETRLSISGMDCPSCVVRLEEGLKDIPGVEGARVNFAAGSASVSYDPAKVSGADLAGAVERMGYSAVESGVGVGAGPARLMVSVGGMTCAACVRRVEKALEAVEGVDKASVNLATNRAEIRFDAGKNGQKGGDKKQDPFVKRHADDEVVFTGGRQEKDTDKCGQDRDQNGRELYILQKQLG